MELTAHQLAEILLEGPDYLVIINGWGSAEGSGPYDGGYAVNGMRSRENGCAEENIELTHEGC